MSLPEEQIENPSVSREKCEEAVKEAVSLLNMLGSISSGVANVKATLLMLGLTLVMLAITHALLIINLLGTWPWGTLFTSVLFIIYFAIFCWIICKQSDHWIEVAEACLFSRSLRELLTEREKALRNCKSFCTEQFNGSFCHDIEKLLSAIKALAHVEKMSPKDWCNWCKWYEKLLRALSR